ncbi:hypothetical protein [Actinomadura madurae]|uniref:hypothetical protein n=1 Tax=Actinomadura madurae TaxID=1993 RepID=UPI001160CE1C|nr:hypothetical protein [Actinomadura madurae]
MSLFITTVGAVLTTLLGVIVGGALSHRLQQLQWSRDRRAEVCALVLRESSNVLVELGKVNGRRMPPAEEGVCIPTPLDWRPWNEALAMVALIADHEVVEAAQEIDAAFWPVGLQVARGWTSDTDWFALRDGIEAKRREFVNIAQTRLAAPGPPLVRLTGRPSSDDQIWELRRSSFPPGASQI